MKKRSWLVAALALFASGCGYNRIQTLDETAASAQSQIEVQLQRRADLIPNLVATVKGYAQHEEEVFNTVAEARSRLLNAVQSKDPEQMANADQQMTGALGRLLAISEAYPNLKADENFLKLQDELTGTENRVAVARSDYNDAVRTYNAYIRTFPAVLTAKMFSSKPRKYFQATEQAQTAVPKVDFSKPDSK
ncbi:MAG: LemA family protein [Gemmatimonadota bacterium]|nr:LemA family protein [Gemmatimonadota bacterium]MDE3128227.1 LemA family protein [Gemmatimonadota bacterium]MDE3173764.1 LemA family protein [Gemmatimonadota bacterium]MDE3216801.1 LemA family protein [Gemmatimonadota bacterium]